MAALQIKANVEQPRIGWLIPPEYVELESSEALQEKLRDIAGYLYIWKNIDECIQFIRSKHGHPYYEQIFLIVTIDYIDCLLQQGIHDVRFLQAIFVFNPNKSKPSFPIKQYPKIEGIYSNSQELLIQLSKSVDNLSKDFDITISTLKGCDDEMTTNIVNNFADFSELWFPLFIDLLFDLPIPSDIVRAQNIKQFANQCQCFYAYDKTKLAQIEQFLSPSDGYSSEIAINYYTRDTFFFKRINKALRYQNFQAILDFRFCLLDMEAQLQTAYSQFSNLYVIGDKMIFYRGQRISKEEMQSLEEKLQTDSLITANSYLSTSIDRKVAMGFIAGSSNGELMPVIFEITAEFKDPDVIRRKPFAFIAHLSYCHKDEVEVLFSVGSFFRVEDIKFNKDENIYTIQLTFIYDEDHYTITDDYSTLKTCSLEEKLIKTGDLLTNHTRHGLTKANTFYKRFLSDNYSPLIKAACHAGLGWLSFKQNKFDLAITYQEQALQMYKIFNNGNYLNYLYVTSYNCIGAVYKHQKQYSKALSYYLRAYKIDSTIIPVDKYAFYNSFNNIASVNIACIYKIQGYIERAWSIYKDILAIQMKESTLFHGAIYLKIAEAGFVEGMSLNTNDEKVECMDNWKRFLDFSLTDMSSNYRRSIVSGALSIGLRFANNEQTWDKAIDYYKKIIQISHKYVSISSDDYSIVVRCYQQIAKLYRKKRNFTLSITYATDGLKLCRVNDLEYITCLYKSMAKTYEQQLQQLRTSLSPEDINAKISFDSRPSPSSSFPTCQKFVLKFERNEFSFGQYKKSINSNLLKETNITRCLAYCLLKIAALNHEQNKTNNIQELLHRVCSLMSDDGQSQFICNNNLAYLDSKFDQIINIYKKTLEERRNNNQTLCIGEDAFYYIAHLYERKNDTDAERQWYINAITYFEEHKFVCEHTQLCFVKLALFYQTKNNLLLCVSTYLKLIHHLITYQNGISQLQREIVVIVEYIIQQLNTNNKEQICILKRLIQLVLKQSEDIILLDADFQWIIDRYKKNKEHSWITTHAYESYLDHILKHITHPLTPYVQTITPAFRQIITAYKLCDDPVGAFDIYQHLTDIILKHSKDRNHIVCSFKQICLDLEQKRQTKAVLDMYKAFHQFILIHPPQIVFENNDLIYYILSRHELIIERDKEAAASIYRIMIHIVRSYKEQHNPEYELKLYLELLEKYYMKLALVEPLSALDSYYNLLDIFLCSCSDRFDKLLAKIINGMKDRPAELLQLLNKYQFNYIHLIRQVYRRLLYPNDQSIICKSFLQTQSSYMNNIMSNFTKKAQRYFIESRSENAITECWTKCIYFLLEDCSKYDEHFASCYIQLNDPVRAINVFDPIVYCNLALKYCPNASRRYLKYVYSKSQMQDKLELHFADHFYLVDGKKEIRPLEPISY